MIGLGLMRFFDGNIGDHIRVILVEGVIVEDGDDNLAEVSIVQEDYIGYAQ